MQIELKDLAAIVAIIDAATERGAFKGHEIGEIGQIRNRVATFVQAAKESHDAAANEETASDE